MDFCKENWDRGRTVLEPHDSLLVFAGLSCGGPPGPGGGRLWAVSFGAVGFEAVGLGAVGLGVVGLGRSARDLVPPEERHAGDLVFSKCSRVHLVIVRGGLGEGACCLLFGIPLHAARRAMTAAPSLPEQRRWAFYISHFPGHRPTESVIVGPPTAPKERQRKNKGKRTRSHQRRK